MKNRQQGLLISWFAHLRYVVIAASDKPTGEPARTRGNIVGEASHMQLRRMSMALIAISALLAIGSAGTQAAQWKIAGSSFAGSEFVAGSTHKNAEGKPVPLVFHSELLGFKVTLTASGIECVGCTITGGTVNSVGKLKFTGVTVDINEKASPSCFVNGGTITTNSLSDEVIMHPLPFSEPIADRFGGFASLEIVTLAFTGSECPLNEAAAKVRGTFCGELVETSSPWKSLRTGEERSTLTFLFGAAQQLTWSCHMTLGAAEAQLTGAIDTKLSGFRAGNVFGVS